jgi:hypothetical protein
MRARLSVLPIAILSSLFIANLASATVIAGFESIALDGAGVYNGSDGAGGFKESTATFNNNFTDFGGGCCWDGWATSNNTDSVTPGFGNQYSAYPGSAAGGSQFGVAYTDIASISLGAPAVVDGGFFTNITYAAQSMINGDAFAKKFGGVSGDDPDYFNITIQGWLAGAKTASEVFYLADYRFADNANDYVLDTWTFVDLSTLGIVDELSFTFDSTDVGSFGVNTPTYFALDDLQIAPEPSTAMMLAMGLIGMAARRRRA